MKKASYLVPLIGYALCGVSFLAILVVNVLLIPSLYQANARYMGTLFIILAVIEVLMLGLSVWGLIGTLRPMKKWTMPFVLITVLVLGALVFPLVPISVQGNDDPASEANLLILALFPIRLSTLVTLGNIPGVVLILIGTFFKPEKTEGNGPAKMPVAINFGPKDEMSVEVERFQSLFKEGLLTEEEAQQQIRDLEPTIL